MLRIERLGRKKEPALPEQQLEERTVGGPYQHELEGAVDRIGQADVDFQVSLVPEQQIAEGRGHVSLAAFRRDDPKEVGHLRPGAAVQLYEGHLQQATAQLDSAWTGVANRYRVSQQVVAQALRFGVVKPASFMHRHP